MQIEIYADVVFLINLFMDFFIFWITAKVCGKKILWLRMIAGSIASALIYCVVMFVYPLNLFLNIFSAVILLAIGIFIALAPKSMGEFLKYILTAHISAFAVGGAGIALFYFTNIGNAIGNFIGFTIQNFSFKILLAATCFSYIVIKLGLNRIRKNLIKKQKFYPLKIYLNDNNISMNGLVDTGNCLYDPITNSPVIIAEFTSIKAVLPDTVKLLFLEKREDDLSSVLSNVVNTSFVGKIRMIPFSSLGKKNGMLIGFKPDKVEVSNDRNNVIIDNVVIGIYNSKLTKNDKYQALLNPELCKFE